MRPGRVTVALAGVVSALALAWPSPASAAFPGRNGELLFSQSDDAGDYWIATSRWPYSVETLLTGTSLGGTGAIWAPSGRLIGFDAESQIWTIHPNGSGLRKLTDVPTGYLSISGFSPDGRLVLFTRSTSRAIWVMRADGTHQHVLEMPPAGSRDFEAVFSPDGRSIAFVRTFLVGTTIRGQILRMRADGSHQVDISNSPKDDGAPDWSPDGTRIVFQRGFNSHQFWQIWAMRADGAHQRDLSRTPAANDTSPTFAPDGRSIVFNRFDSIWRMRSDGTHRRQLIMGIPGFESFSGGSLRPLPR